MQIKSGEMVMMHRDGGLGPRYGIVMAVMHNVQLAAHGPRGNYLRVRWNDGETEDIEADSAGNHEGGNRS